MDSEEDKDTDTEEVQVMVGSALLGGSANDEVGSGEAKFDAALNTFICKNILCFLLHQTPCISFLTN